MPNLAVAERDAQQSIVGMCVAGSDADEIDFEYLLETISSGSFPRGEKRNNLTDGQLRQIRDAMIFCTHIREKRHIFVTNDRKGFVNTGRREILEERYCTRIYTRDEFIEICDAVFKNNA